MAISEIHIGYVGANAGQEDEDAAVHAWLESESARVCVLDHDRFAESLQSIDVLWIHAPDADPWENKDLDASSRERLLAFLRKGGGVLCTGYAALLPARLGIERVPPEARAVDVADAGYGRGRGFQSFGSHPILEPLFGGAFVWNSDRDHQAWRVGYFDDRWPADGKVLAVERSYITLHQDNKLVIEHWVGLGRMLSVGGLIHFGRPNRSGRELRTFIRTVLEYLHAGTDAGDTYPVWRRDAVAPTSFQVQSSRPNPGPPFDARALLNTGMALKRDRAGDEYFDVAGRRCLIMGTERGGIDELWCHPFRVLKDMETSVLLPEGELPLCDADAAVEIFPEALVRNYRLPGGNLRETLFASLEKPGACIRYEADHETRILIRLTTDFRWMWPYDSGALGHMEYGFDESVGALHVRDTTGQFYVVFGADRKPDDALFGPYEELSIADAALKGLGSASASVSHGAVYSVVPQRPVHFGISGTNQGRDEAEATWLELVSNPRAHLREAADHYRNLLQTVAVVTTPDEHFNEGYRWALVATERFKATVPKIGSGLLAGYGTTKRGWNGGHDISGRPGYAWLFARDAQWACMALNACGDFDAVRDQLALFERFQDDAGKVFFEIPLSGIVHYDAADVTPLYVILAADYLRASGDVKCLEKLWPSIARALDFLFSTDTNGDGLIENTNVGHGWIEGGELHGAATTLYLAALWGQALRDAVFLATVMEEASLAAKIEASFERAKDRLDIDFWNDEGGHYFYGKLPDGSFRDERTIFGAIPALFQLTPPDRASRVLDAYASNEFSTDWGCRIISAHSQLFDPAGYHYGTIWPLFTGWTALAEYAYGRPAQAFTHIMNNLLIYRHWALGLIEEVLNGDRFMPAGVCAHQCWSETNVIHPVLSGMIGFSPDALEGRARVAPSLPAHWDSVRVERLRVGETVFELEFERKDGEVTYRLERSAGAPIVVELVPQLPLGIRTLAAAVIRDGAEQSLDPIESEAGVTFTLDDRVAYTFRFEGGMEVLPLVAYPNPGDRSSRNRIISQRFDADLFELTVEGPSGASSIFRVRSFSPGFMSVDGAAVVDGDERGIFDLKCDFHPSSEDWSRKVIRITRAEERDAIAGSPPTMHSIQNDQTAI